LPIGCGYISLPHNETNRRLAGSKGNQGGVEGVLAIKSNSINIFTTNHGVERKQAVAMINNKMELVIYCMRNGMDTQ